jgi:hypothetical protein
VDGVLTRYCNSARSQMAANGMVRLCSCPTARTIGVMSWGLVSISWSDGRSTAPARPALNMLMKGFAARLAARAT